MADESTFYALIGRALLDKDFRDRLLDMGQQEDALREIGIEPTDDIKGRLNDSAQAIADLAGSGDFGEVAAVT